MKWVDDAKAKAAKAAQDTAAKATEEAGKSAVRNAIGAVEQRVGAIAENLLSAAERELEKRQEAAEESVDEGEEEEDEEEDVDTVVDAAAVGPTLAEQREAAARAELAALKANEPPPLPDPPSMPDEQVHAGTAASVSPPQPRAVPVAEEQGEPADLFSAANEALRRAADARGSEFEPPEARQPGDPQDPMAAAEAALAQAAGVRETLGRSPAARAREERAIKELARLKAAPGAAAATSPDTDSEDDGDTPPNGPKKRSL